MTDPAVPQRLAFEKRLQELERQVRDLQRSPSLTRASVTGYVSVRESATGPEVMRIGELEAGAYGMRILSVTDKEVLRITDNGWLYPKYPVPFAHPNLQLSTTSTSFVVIGEARFNVVSQYLYLGDLLTIPNGNTIESRIRMTVYVPPNPSITINTWSDTGAGTNHGGFFDMANAAWGVDPWGAEAEVFWEIRRSAGATNVLASIRENAYQFGI